MPRPRGHRRPLWILAPFLLALLAGAGPARGASESDVRAVGEQLVCYCGCSGLTVAACTCGTADQIRDRIRSQLDGGLTPAQVVDAWVQERGEQVLAVPTREGFNLVGWIMPFLVTVMALAVLTWVLLRRQRGGPREAAPPAEPLSERERSYLAQVERGVRDLSR